MRELVTSLGDVGGASSDGYEINGGSVLLALADRLGTPATWPQLAAALAAARAGDLDPVSEIVQQGLGGTDVARQQSGRLVYRCNDSAQRLGGTELAAAATAARGRGPAVRAVRRRPARCLCVLAGDRDAARGGPGHRRAPAAGRRRGRRPGRAVLVGPVADHAARLRHAADLAVRYARRLPDEQLRRRGRQRLPAGRHGAGRGHALPAVTLRVPTRVTARRRRWYRRRSQVLSVVAG